MKSSITKQLILLLSAAAVCALFSASGGQATGWCTYSNVVSGYMVQNGADANLGTGDLAACVAACDEMPGCTAVQHYYNGTCLVATWPQDPSTLQLTTTADTGNLPATLAFDSHFSEFPADYDVCSRVARAVNRPASDWCVLSQADTVGNDLEGLIGGNGRIVSGFADCLDRCLINTSCLSLTFDIHNRKCWLKGKPVAYPTHLESGVYATLGSCPSEKVGIAASS